MDFPSREDHTLVLIFTSHSSHKIRCKPLPPIGLQSDHDVVIYDTSLQAVRTKPVKRKICLWKQADTPNIKTTLSNNSNPFLTGTFDSIEDMWQNFKIAFKCTSTMGKFVSFKCPPPWIITGIHGATRRKQRAHRKAKATRRKKDWNRYKGMQSSIQKEIREAHKQYMENVVSSDLKQNPQNFWSFIKSKSHDSTGVSPIDGQSWLQYSDGKKKVEISQFHPAYTRQDTS